MSFQGPQPQSTMTTKEMAKSFSPIILFSIVLPLIDIFTDLRMIFILFSRALPYCIDDKIINIYGININDCSRTNDIVTYCQNKPNLCRSKIHKIYATMLLGKYKKVLYVPSRLFNNTTVFSTFLVKLYCFIHNLVSDGEEQDLDICSATT